LDVDIFSSPKLTALGMAMVMVRFMISIVSMLQTVILLARVHTKMTPSTSPALFGEFCTSSLDPIEKPIMSQVHLQSRAANCATARLQTHVTR